MEASASIKIALDRGSAVSVSISIFAYLHSFECVLVNLLGAPKRFRYT